MTVSDLGLLGHMSLADGHLLEWVPLVVLAAWAWLYLRAVARSRGVGPLTMRTAVPFLIGVAAVAVALTPPLETAAERSLAAHMGQHVMLLAAPLGWVVGRAGRGAMVGLDPPVRGALVRTMRPLHVLSTTLTRRLVAAPVLVIVVIGWHVPAAYEAAVRSPVLHVLEHLMFLAAAALYWMSLLGARPSYRRTYGASLLALFAIMLVGTAGGALMTLAETPLYPLHAARATAAGIDWLVDQQTAGLIMWVPLGVVNLVVFVWLTSVWLRAVDSAASTSRSVRT